MLHSDEAYYAPKSKRKCIANTSTSSSAAPCTSVTQLRTIVQDLDMNEIAQYFLQEEAAPYVVCDGIDVDVFNRYFGHENLPIPLRCVELLEGQLLIVEYPISAVHESTIHEFEYEFMHSCGDGRQFGKKGSTTCHRGGNPDKEADATYGPLRDTPGRTPPPVLNNGSNHEIQDWITLAVEVGRAQPWASLERAAIWWLEYPGIQYVLLIKVIERARAMSYCLYDILNYAHQNQLPAPVATQSFRNQANGAAINIALDNDGFCRFHQLRFYHLV
ncbi:hypothetical protein THRCLA_04999 [Thraustotheca clavata]|uniref:Uncharacterized protein n=1 Tax=Thraustotheca clavata TaxID=74557 RepID=A0A1V9ZXW9_9STRA|nr:hypothetical protein THRCLA_04999 [Thraustotheca clavata]